MHTDIAAEALPFPFVAYPLRTFLDIATGHLRPETRDTWTTIGESDPEGFPVTVFAGPFGWVLHVPMSNDAWDYRYGTEMFAVFHRARSMGAEYVMFDADAERLDGLAWFDEPRDEEAAQALGWQLDEGAQAAGEWAWWRPAEEGDTSAVKRDEGWRVYVACANEAIAEGPAVPQE